MAQRRSWKISGLLLLALMTILVMVYSIRAGTANISYAELFAVLFSTASSQDAMTSSRTIIMDIRLPRIAMGLAAGGALAVAGTAFQSLLRNPLADPYILGVSGGAALGGVLAITLKQASFSGAVQLYSFAGALATIFFVYYISRINGSIPKYKMLLAGVIVNSFLSALIMLVLSISSPDQIGSALFWLMGDLGRASWKGVIMVLPYLISGGAVLYLMSKEMNLLLLGEERAIELGVNIERAKVILFVASSLITGAVVSVCGLIGFVGLIVPHGARLIWGADHRYLIPASLLMGGGFLLLADTLARTVISPIELPVGVITAIMGAPVFVYLMKRRLHE